MHTNLVDVYETRQSSLNRRKNFLRCICECLRNQGMHEERILVHVLSRHLGRCNQLPL
jgi:hypothetical protein